MGILDGRVAIVTGASSGIGRACALRFAEEGAKVIGCARRMEKLQELVRDVESKGGEALAVACDVAEERDITNVVDTAADQYGRIDILANIAQGGIEEQGIPLEDVTPKQLLDTFVTGPIQSLLFMQKCFPYMKAQHYGRIINTASHTIMGVHPGYAFYGPAKAAVVTLSRFASQEWAQFGIVTNTFIPWAITPSWDNRASTSPDPAKLAAQVPLRRVGTAYEDVSPVVAFLASEAAGYLNGVTLGVNGGKQILA
jgi:NAD(P)-dependent dehydrogenase (short-subunit alcohol dehydrogenase family)